MKKTNSDISAKSQQQGWQCQACTFKNYPKILICQICSTEKSGVPKQNIMQKQKSEQGFICHACQFKLKQFVVVCTNCGEVLIPQEQQDEIQKTEIKKKQGEKEQKSTKMVNCPSCGKENDPINQECVFCQYNIKNEDTSALIPIKKRAPIKAKVPRYGRYGYRAPMGVGACQYCKMAVYGMTLEAHELGCTKFKGQALQIKYLQVEKKHCAFCYQKFDSSLYDDHDRKCQARKQFFSRDSPTYKRCTKLQIDTMIYMHNTSQKLHWISQSPLMKRITSLGFKASDLENLHHYIVNYAPIIIHMHVSRHMQFFVKDTHYRNQFQTKKSSGSLSQTSRISWQDRMFDHLHHSAKPFERVKYGTINFTNDPKGVRACVGYGMSYFLLKPHVRNRCTVTDMDSSSPSATIATFQFCYHLLNKLPDAQLQAAFQGSRANEVASHVIGTYKQIQIHGPVQFKQDIQRVYVNKAQLADPKYQKMVKQFCKKNDLQYEVFGEDPPKAAVPFGGATGIFPASSSFGFSGGFFGSSPSIFSAPVPSPSTAHLFHPGRGRGRGRYPIAATIPPAYIDDVQKQLEEGVDYI